MTLQSQSFSAKFTTTSALNLEGDSLIEPLALQLNLPVSLAGRLNMLQRFGVRVFGSCSTKGSDHFSFLGSLSTTAKLLVGLHLNPSLGHIESGDYALVIEPRVAVISSLDDTDIKFRVSGASPIAAVYTAVTGLTSTFLKSLTKLLTGDSATAEFENVFQNDVLYPLVLGVGSLPRPVEEALFERFLKVGEKAVTAAGSKFGDGLEESLRNEVSRALQLDEDGRRTIILKKEAVDLIRLGGVNLDAFVERPPNPSQECMRTAQVGCIGSRGSLLPGCSEKFARCSQLGQAYTRQYTATGLRRSKSRIEAAIEARQAPTGANTGSGGSGNGSGGAAIGRDECIRQANRLCSSCRGCSQCVQRQRLCSEIAESPKATPTAAGRRAAPPPRDMERERCVQQANRLCSSCRGCSECVARQRACREL